LVFHMTNWVTIYDCANIVKVLGASPVMAFATEEIEDMTNIASSLVLNIGTLTTQQIEGMKMAIDIANGIGAPIVLDICGNGATGLRNDKTKELLEDNKVDIVKGNASEIACLAGMDTKTRGVDSGEVREDMRSLAGKLAENMDCTVVVTGKDDVISDGDRCYICSNGHKMMSSVVGTGCMATSVIGAFAAIDKDLSNASVSALGCYGIASEKAVESSRGPGSFKEALFDELYHLSSNDIIERIKVYQC